MRVCVCKDVRSQSKVSLDVDEVSTCVCVCVYYGEEVAEQGGVLQS